MIILNTVGGDVEAGLAISELICGMKKPTVSLVLGGGHSIGVPLAVSADCSFIVPTATMTVHPVRMNGMVLGVRESLDVFLKMQERITDFVVRNSNISAKRFNWLMTRNGQLEMCIRDRLQPENFKTKGKAHMKKSLIIGKRQFLLAALVLILALAVYLNWRPVSYTHLDVYKRQVSPLFTVAETSMQSSSFVMYATPLSATAFLVSSVKGLSSV